MQSTTVHPPTIQEISVKKQMLYTTRQTGQVLMIFMGQRKNDISTNDYILKETAADHV